MEEERGGGREGEVGILTLEVETDPQLPSLHASTRKKTCKRPAPKVLQPSSLLHSIMLAGKVRWYVKIEEWKLPPPLWRVQTFSLVFRKNYGRRGQRIPERGHSLTSNSSTVPTNACFALLPLKPFFPAAPKPRAQVSSSKR